MLRFLGQISYGLYLIHVLSYNLCTAVRLRFAPALGARNGAFGPILARLAIGGGVAVGLAWLSRNYFEEPFLRLKDRPWAPGAGAVQTE